MPDATTDSFKAWHTWYKNDAQVNNKNIHSFYPASINEPQVTKDSCENLHGTFNVPLGANTNCSGLSSDYIAALKNYNTDIDNSIKENKKTEIKFKQSLTEQLTTYFGDTLCEFYDELTPLEIVQSFHEAIKRNFMLYEKELNKAKELLEFVDKININA